MRDGDEGSWVGGSSQVGRPRLETCNQDLGLPFCHGWVHLRLRSFGWMPGYWTARVTETLVKSYPELQDAWELTWHTADCGAQQTVGNELVGSVSSLVPGS